MRPRPYTLVLVTLVLLSSTLASAADWPQFRGPGRDGLTSSEGLLRSWGEDGLAVAWRRSIGPGFSGVAVVGDRLYTMAAEDDQEVVHCLDAATGETVWKRALSARFEDQFSDGPRSTPTVDGERLYAVTADAILAALKTADGEILWRHDLKEAFAGKPPRFGYASSPLVDGDLLLVDAGGAEGQGVVALDKTTGEKRWSVLEGAAAHSSPIAVEIGGVRQVVFHRRVAEKTVGLVGVSTDGKVLWTQEVAPDTIVMPLFIPPDRFFTASGTLGDGGKMFRVKKDGDAFVAEELWTYPRMRNHFNTSVVVRGHIYGFDNSTLRCLDAATGEERWAKRGFGKGSVVAADDLLYVLGDQGTLALAEATPEGYRELGRIEAMEGRSWTPPTLAGGRIYLRDLDELVSYEIGGKATAMTAAMEKPAAGASAMPAATPKTADEVVARWSEARGGLEAWRKIETLAAEGTYATFSQTGPFRLVRQRGEAGDHYRIEHQMLGEKVVRARDADGPWWVFPLIEVAEPARIVKEVEAYLPQLAREAMLEPPLLGYAEKGIAVKLLGDGEVNGSKTVDLELTFPDGEVETWHLDPTTWLETAVDSTVVDYTQLPRPMTERAYFSDFREVAGVKVPFQVSKEFGARLEEVVVQEVEANPEVGEGTFTGPEPKPAEEAEAEAGGQP